mgnify:FL=1|jgi:hypothetical protein|tara:strand:- start:479 stop:913 length:435 start_codon:yes stop_codon:yes gene_type:complete
MAPFVRVRRKTHRKLPERITGPSKVKVGFPAGKTGGDILDRAIWNHFGTETIPERPFITSAIRDNRGAYQRAMRVSALKILMGETSLRTVLSKLGALAQGDIQAEIVSLSDPPNSPVTIARKGSSNPLIDTGQMRSSVSWKIGE